MCHVKTVVKKLNSFHYENEIKSEMVKLIWQLQKLLFIRLGKWRKEFRYPSYSINKFKKKINRNSYFLFCKPFSEIKKKNEILTYVTDRKKKKNTFSQKSKSKKKSIVCCLKLRKTKSRS